MGYLVAAAIVAVAVPAKAEPRSETVSYADLDLASVAGRKALERRISRAVRSVCGIRAAEPLFMHQQRRMCIATAQRSSEGQVALAIARAEQRQARLTTRN